MALKGIPFERFVFSSIHYLRLFIWLTVCAFTLLSTAVHGENEQEVLDFKKFNLVVEDVIELKKTDLAGALTQLTIYKNVLNKLTAEQNLLYFKVLTEIYIEQNKYSTAKETAELGLIAAKKLASPSILMSEVLYLKGFALESLGDLSQATNTYKTGLEVAGSLHDNVQIASGLINLGAIAYLTDEFERSLVLLNDAYNIAGQTDDEELKGMVNTELGIVYSHLQQDEQSMTYYQQSYSHFKKAGLLLAAHNSLQNIAVMHLSKNQYQNAITVFETIISESNENSPSDRMYSVYSGLAWAYLRKENSNANTAYEYLLMAKQYVQATEKIENQIDYYYAESYILERLARFDDALASIGKLEKIINSHPEMSLVKKQNYVNVFGLKAKVLYQQHKYKAAYDEKSKEIALTDKLYENEDNRSIAEVRLKLEGERADKETKALHNQKLLYETDLIKANAENKEQQFYMIITALVTLAFAWVLIKLLQSQKKLNIASNIDALTGVDNRHSLMKKSQHAFKFAKVNENDFSLLVIDIDHFKDINDRRGHHLGDKVLAQVASLGANMMRKSDIFGRFGGDKFMVCLPKSSNDTAFHIGERIRSCVNEHPWEVEGLNTVSVSIGVISLTDENDIIQLIKKAEEHILQAKSLGRNRVCG